MTAEGHDAPRTTLDARPTAPGTTRDGAPGTTRDGATRDAAPGTTRDGAPATTRDGAERPFHRVNLPPTLSARFTIERELGSGGEADVLLVKERSGGALSVVRLYRRQDLALEEDKLARLRQADRRHLIGLLDYGKGDGYVWEILEYAAGGSLDQAIDRDRGPWTTDRVLPVLDQLTEAVAYANSLGLVHRDIKPANILVRSLDPPDLVLADFGLAKFIAATRQMGSTSRTSAYAPPEAISGQASRSWDWWSLGIVMVELLTGLNPFQRPDRGWQDEAMILSELTTHEIDLAAITDPRWQLLCRGLLTRAPEKRWGPQQVAMWRSGGSPAVAEPDRPRSHRRSRGTYVFAGVGYDDPVALAGALRADWGEGRRLMAGRAVNAPPYLALRDWLAGREELPAVRALDGGAAERPERTLIQLILALDPESPPEYNGSRLDLEHLHALVREATVSGGRARDLLELVYGDGILTICDGHPGCAGYAMLDDRWHRSAGFADNRLSRLRLTVPPAELRSLRVQLLATSFEGQQGAFAEAARVAGQDEDAREQEWFRTLTSEQTQPAAEAAQHAVVMLCAPIAARQTDEQFAAAERFRIAEEERRRQESRARIDRISGPLGVICGLLAACTGFLAPVASPAAIYFGVRARRSNRTASTWAIALGAIGVLAFVWWVTKGASGNPQTTP